MANPLYESMMKKQRQNNPLANMSQFMQDLQKLKTSGINDPNQKIQQMLDSGQITQEQYNQAVAKAQQLQQLSKFFG